MTWRLRWLRLADLLEHHGLAHLCRKVEREIGVGERRQGGDRLLEVHRNAGVEVRAAFFDTPPAPSEPAERPVVLGRVDHCTISGFYAVGPKGGSPLAYVVDPEVYGVLATPSVDRGEAVAWEVSIGGEYHVTATRKSDADRYRADGYDVVPLVRALATQHTGESASETQAPRELDKDTSCVPAGSPDSPQRRATMSNDLKPCPFCGTEAHYTSSNRGHAVECMSPSCWAQMPWRIALDDAIAAWNCRSPSHGEAVRECGTREGERIEGWALIERDAEPDDPIMLLRTDRRTIVRLVGDQLSRATLILHPTEDEKGGET